MSERLGTVVFGGGMLNMIGTFHFTVTVVHTLLDVMEIFLTDQADVAR